MPERELPPNFKHRIDLAFHRKLTFKERVKALLGWNLEVQLVIFTEHRPGKFETKRLELTLTEVTDPMRPRFPEEDYPAPSIVVPSTEPGRAYNSHSPASNRNTDGNASSPDRTSHSGSNPVAVAGARHDARHRDLERRLQSERASQASGTGSKSGSPQQSPSTIRGGGKP